MDKRLSGQTAGAFSLSVALVTVSSSWKLSAPNIILDSPTFSEGPAVNDERFGDWKVKAKYLATYEVTFTGDANLEFNYFGAKIKIGASKSATHQWTLEHEVEEFVHVKE